MGLFDRLFGKKEDQPAEEVLEEVATEVIAEDNSSDEVSVDEAFSVEEQSLVAGVTDTEDDEFISADAVFEEETEATQPTFSEEDAATTSSVEQVTNEVANRELVRDAIDQATNILPTEEITVEETEHLSTNELEVDSQSLDLSEVKEIVMENSSSEKELVNGETPSKTAEEELSQGAKDFYAEYMRQKERVAQAIANGQDLSELAQKTRHDLEPEPVQEPIVSEPVETEQEKYNRTLKKTRTGFGAMLNNFLANFRTVDEEFFEELEEMLILSDVGVTVATNLTEELRHEARLENAKKPEDLKRVIIEKLVDLYEKDGFDSEKINLQPGLTVMLFVGVNGVGKTTSIGKLAYRYKNQGKKVMLVAADTFRAGAVAQLAEWGRRVAVPVVTGPEKADPASVVFDGMEKAVAEGVDILLIDTAGRLQNKDNLMAELEKIGRIIKRVLPEAPHETLLALDASTGQNALVQAKEFSKITPLTGLVLTKLDGTAKGGIVLAIREELDIPVKFIGFGEKIDDIGQFNSEDFMRGLLEGII